MKLCFQLINKIKRPSGQGSLSFLCELSKEALVASLSAPATQFKEMLAGTQYWSRIAADKAPKLVPNTCDYNSQLLKDDVANFVKTHCLIGDYVAATLVAFVHEQASALAVDTLTSSTSSAGNSDESSVRVYYLGTADGRVVRVSSANPFGAALSEWKLGDEAIGELKIGGGGGGSLFASGDAWIGQVELSAQCAHYAVCAMCANDPYCGWNGRTRRCEAVSSAAPLLVTSKQQCSSGRESETTSIVAAKTMQVESDSGVVQLECELNAAAGGGYLLDAIEWHRDGRALDPTSSSSGSIFLTRNKELVIAAGNSSHNGVYTCFVLDEALNSYSLTFKPGKDISSKYVYLS